MYTEKISLDKSSSKEVIEMPLKYNKAGKLQACDPKTGHYAHMTAEDFAIKLQMQYKPVKLTKEQKREIHRQQILERAQHSKDKCLPEAVFAIERNFPYSVIDINHKVYDKNLLKKREIDITTKHAIVEVKGSAATKRSKQLLGQKKFAEFQGKIHILYAPNISKATKFAYNKIGINVATNLNELISFIRRHKK